MIPERTAEVVILGAGVSGLALAVALGRQGREVCLVDMRAAPRDKVCGEGVMPLGLRCLARLGLDPSAWPGVDFDGLDYLAVSPHGAIRHALRFPPGVLGRGIRHTRLIEALERAALDCPGVTVELDEVRGVDWDGGRVTALRGQRAVYRGRVLVAADGVNSRLARWCPARTWQYGARLALRRHYRLRPGCLPPRVQVGLLGSHDVYLTPVGPDELLATTLTDRRGYRAAAADYDAFLRSGPYGALFAAAEPVSPCLSGYHPLFHARRFVPGGVFLVGDAGGGIDPCLGLGMSLGLHTALAAAEAIGASLGNPAARAAAERAFSAERRRLFHHYHHFGTVFRALAGSPRGARMLMRIMGRLPRLAERVLAIVADFRPWRSLALRGRAG